jgi:hypothetical protein
MDIGDKLLQVGIFLSDDGLVAVALNAPKRQGCGFRDIEFLKLKIMGIHTTRYALVG